MSMLCPSLDARSVLKISTLRPGVVIDMTSVARAGRYRWRPRRTVYVYVGYVIIDRCYNHAIAAAAAAAGLASQMICIRSMRKISILRRPLRRIVSSRSTSATSAIATVYSSPSDGTDNLHEEINSSRGIIIVLPVLSLTCVPCFLLCCWLIDVLFIYLFIYLFAARVSACWRGIYAVAILSFRPWHS